MGISEKQTRPTPQGSLSSVYFYFLPSRKNAFEAPLQQGSAKEALRQHDRVSRTNEVITMAEVAAATPAVRSLNPNRPFPIRSLL